MQVNSTSPIASVTGATQSDNGSTLPVQTLNQQDFLKLLVAQLQAQDPLNPQTDTQFIAQMASFSALEQSKQMTADVQQLGTQQQLLQANDLIGRSVTLQNADGTLTTGTVSSVQVQAGVPSIVINGQSYDLSALLAIAPAATTTTQVQGA